MTSFVIVGGVVTRLYMPERMTDDLGILVCAEDLNQLDQELLQSGAEKIGQPSISGGSWKLTDGTLLDVIKSNQVWVREALSNPQLAPDGLPVIDLSYLVLMKLQASRAQDLADISRMLGGAAPAMLDSVQRLLTNISLRF